MNAIIESIIEEAPLVRRFRIKSDLPLMHKPGQFVMLGAADIKVSRPYSIASSPTESEYFDLIIKKVTRGRFTVPLFEKKVGDALEVKGPFGTFYYQDGLYAPIVLIGGGTGLAPLRSIVRYLRAKNIKIPIKLFFGSRTKKDLLFKSEFEKLAAENMFFSYFPVINACKGADWSGYAGNIVESLIAENVTDLRAPHFYLCGPPIMVASIIQELDAHGVPHEHIKREQW